MITKFNTDEELFQWMDINPKGFILSTKKSKNTSNFSLHKPKCKHVARSKQFIKNGLNYTQGDKLKIGASNTSLIVEYCRKEKSKFIGDFKICTSCNPEYTKETEIIYANEIQIEESLLTEGAIRKVIVNSYERNPEARKTCIEYFGCNCQCCGLDFEQRYGEIGKGFIHVHHLKEISKIGEEYVVDPILDLIPLCPNCHAMAHKRKEPFTVKELREIMNLDV